MGLLPIVGMEPEFFLLRRTETGELAPLDTNDGLDKPCYDLGALLRGCHELLGQIVAMMQAPWTGRSPPSTTRTATASTRSTSRTPTRSPPPTGSRCCASIIADIAGAHGAIASFMPKPLPAAPGRARTCTCVGAGAGRRPTLRRRRRPPRARPLPRRVQLHRRACSTMRRALAALTMPTVNSYRRVQAATTTSGATWAPNAVVYGGEQPDDDAADPRHRAASRTAASTRRATRTSRSRRSSRRARRRAPRP